MPVYSTERRTFVALNVSLSTKQRLKMPNGPLKLFFNQEAIIYFAQSASFLSLLLIGLTLLLLYVNSSHIMLLCFGVFFEMPFQFFEWSI